MATIEDLSKLDIRIGTITNVEDVEGARKAVYKMTIDFGAEVGVRTVVAGIKNHYTKEELMGSQIACIVNLDPKNIAGVESQGMILAGDTEDLVPAVLRPDKKVPNGSKIH